MYSPDYRAVNYCIYRRGFVSHSEHVSPFSFWSRQPFQLPTQCIFGPLKNFCNVSRLITQYRSLAQPSFSLRKESSAGETILAAAIHEHQLLMIAYSIPNGEVYLYLQRIVIVEGVPALHQIGDSIILLRCPHCLLIAKFGRSVHGLIGYSEPAGYEQDISLIDAYNLQEDSGFTNRCSMAWDRSQGQ